MGEWDEKTDASGASWRAKLGITNSPIGREDVCVTYLVPLRLFLRKQTRRRGQQPLKTSVERCPRGHSICGPVNST